MHDHHDDRRDPAVPDRTDTAPDAPRERVTDRDWNRAGGDPDASPVLGGTTSHQRPSFNDPAAGNPDPIIGTSGLAAEEAAGTRSPVAPSSSSEERVEKPVDQRGADTSRAGGAIARDSDAARREHDDDLDPGDVRAS